MSNLHKAYLSALFLIPSMITLRIALALLGLITVPLGVSYCMASGKDKFPKILWLWDNEEDGYDGNKKGWYDWYLKKYKGKQPVTGFKRWLRSVNWSMLRNPTNNMQRAKWISWPVYNPQDIVIKKDSDGYGHTIAIKPEGSKIYHLSLKKDLGKIRFRTGFKTKPRYYGKDRVYSEDRERTTYTISFFIDDKKGFH